MSDEYRAMKAHVDRLTRDADQHNKPCRCVCQCPQRLTMPSEWSRGTCIFCRDGEHASGEPLKPGQLR